MKTRIFLFSALLAGSTAFATDTTTNYGGSGPSSKDDRKPDSMNRDMRESAYDSAMKPDRTMRHDTLQGRASTDSKYDVDRENQGWETRDRKTDQGPATRE